MNDSAGRWARPALFSVAAGAGLTRRGAGISGEVARGRRLHALELGRAAELLAIVLCLDASLADIGAGHLIGYARRRRRDLRRRAAARREQAEEAEQWNRKTHGKLLRNAVVVLSPGNAALGAAVPSVWRQHRASRFARDGISRASHFLGLARHRRAFRRQLPRRDRVAGARAAPHRSRPIGLRALRRHA